MKSTLKKVEKSMSLSVRLLRERASIDNALRSNHGFDRVESKAGTLFIGRSGENSPDWLELVSGLTGKALGGYVNQSCGAVYFLSIPNSSGKSRTMCISFGTGFHILNVGAFERSFGLKTTLSILQRDHIRNLDVASLDAIVMQRRIQASKESNIHGFGVDFDSDIVRLAAGTPTNKSFATSLAGKDALTIRSEISANTLAKKCGDILKVYDTQAYKINYAWIDHISIVREPDILDRLDSALFAEIETLVKGGSSELYMALPDILDPNDGYEIGYFGLGLKRGKKKTLFYQVDIADYIAQLREGNFSKINNVDDIRLSHEIRVVVNGEGDRKRRQRVYDCFIFEAKLDGKTFIIFDGEWFHIEKDYHKLIEDDFRRIQAPVPFIASTAAVNEQEFIDELDKRPDLLKMDRARITPSGVSRADIEPCDFLSKRQELIHLKDGHSSGPISHLWNQGIVSAECFLSDSKFRADFKHEVKQRQKKTGKSGFDVVLPDGRSKPNSRDYKIIYGILRTQPGGGRPLSIPFFSKVSLRAAVSRIELWGYPVELHLIAKIAAPATVAGIRRSSQSKRRKGSARANRVKGNKAVK